MIHVLRYKPINSTNDLWVSDTFIQLSSIKSVRVIHLEIKEEKWWNSDENIGWELSCEFRMIFRKRGVIFSLQTILHGEKFSYALRVNIEGERKCSKWGEISKFFFTLQEESVHLNVLQKYLFFIQFRVFICRMKSETLNARRKS